MNFDGLTPAQRTWKETTTETASQTVSQTIETFFSKVSAQSIRISREYPSLPRDVYHWILNNICRLRESDRPALEKVSQAFKTLLNRRWHQEKWVGNFNQILQKAGNESFREYTHFLARTNPKELINHFDDLLIEDDEQKAALVKSIAYTDRLLAIRSIKAFKIASPSVRRELASFLFKDRHDKALFRIKNYLSLFDLPEMERLNFFLDYMKFNSRACVRLFKDSPAALALSDVCLSFFIQELLSKYSDELLNCRDLITEPEAENFLNHLRVPTKNSVALLIAKIHPQVVAKNFQDIGIEDDDAKVALVKKIGVSDPLVAIQNIQNYQIASPQKCKELAVFLFQQDKNKALFRIQKYLPLFNLPESERLSFIIDYSLEDIKNSIHLLENVNTPKDVLHLNEENLSTYLEHLANCFPDALIKCDRLFKPTVVRVGAEYPVYKTGDKECLEWKTNPPQISMSSECWHKVMRSLFVNTSGIVGCLKLNSKAVLQLLAEDGFDVTVQEKIIEEADENALAEHFETYGLTKFDVADRLQLSKRFVKRCPKVSAGHFSQFESTHRTELASVMITVLCPKNEKDIHLDRYSIVLNLLEHLDEVDQSLLVTLALMFSASPKACEKWFENSPFTTWDHEKKLGFIRELVKQDPAKGVMVARHCKDVSWYEVVEMSQDIFEKNLKGLSKFLDQRSTHLERVNREEFSERFPELSKKLDRYERSLEMMRALYRKRYRVLSPLLKQAVASADYPELVLTACRHHPPLVAYMMRNAPLKTVSVLENYFPMNLFINNPEAFINVLIELKKNPISALNLMRKYYQPSLYEFKAFSAEELSKLEKIEMKDLVLAFFQQTQNIPVAGLSQEALSLFTKDFMFSIESIGSQIYQYAFQHYAEAKKRAHNKTLPPYYRVKEWTPPPNRVLDLFSDDLIALIEEVGMNDYYSDYSILRYRVKAKENTPGHDVVQKLEKERIDSLILKLGFQELVVQYTKFDMKAYDNFYDLVPSDPRELLKLIEEDSSGFLFSYLRDEHLIEVVPLIPLKSFKEYVSVVSPSVKSRLIFFRCKSLPQEEILCFYRFTDLLKLDFTPYLESYPQEVAKLNRLKAVFEQVKILKKEGVGFIDRLSLLSKDPQLFIEFLTLLPAIHREIACLLVSQARHLIEKMLPDLHTLSKEQLVSIRPYISGQQAKELIDNPSSAKLQKPSLDFDRMVDNLDRACMVPLAEDNDFLSFLTFRNVYLDIGFLFYATDAQKRAYLKVLNERNLLESNTFDPENRIKSTPIFQKFKEASTAKNRKNKAAYLEAFNQLISWAYTYNFVSIYLRSPSIFSIEGVFGLLEASSSHFPSVLGTVLDNFSTHLEDLCHVRFIELVNYLYIHQTKLNEWSNKHGVSSLGLTPYELIQKCKRQPTSKQINKNIIIETDKFSISEAKKSGKLSHFVSAAASDPDTYNSRNIDEYTQEQATVIFPFASLPMQIRLSKKVIKPFSLLVFNKVKILIESESYEEFIGRDPNTLPQVIEALTNLTGHLTPQENKNLQKVIEVLREINFVRLAANALKEQRNGEVDTYIKENILKSSNLLICLKLMIKFFPELTSYFIKDRGHIIKEKIKELFADLNQIDVQSRISLLPLLPPDLACRSILEVSGLEKKCYLNEPFKFDDYNSSTLGVLRDVARDHIKDQDSIPPLRYQTFQNMLNAIPMFTLAYMACQETNEETTLLWLPLMNNIQAASAVPAIPPLTFVKFMNGEGKSMRDFYLAYATNRQKEAFLNELSITIKIPEPALVHIMPFTISLRKYERLHSVLLSNDASETVQKATEEKVCPVIKEIEDFLVKCQSLIPEEDPTPNEFLCPITRMVMEDPCTDGGVTGMHFEREAFMTHWNARKTHPITHKKYDIANLTSDNALKTKIEEWKKG